MLQHKFLIEKKDGTMETRTSTLCEYGAPTGSGGYSAMAKLVGIPAGVGKLGIKILRLGADICLAVKQVLDGTISEPGILAPMNTKINEPLIKELKDTYG